MTADVLTLEVVLADDANGVDGDELAGRVAALSAELLDLDVHDVAPASAGDAPVGTKGLELVAVGALLVQVGRSAEILRQVIDAIRDWAGRNDTRTVKVALGGDTLEITGASKGDMQAVVEAWVQRHSER